MRGLHSKPRYTHFCVQVVDCVYCILVVLRLYAGQHRSRLNSLVCVSFLSQEQKQWSDMQRLLRSITPHVQKFEPHHPVRKAVFKFVTHTKFDQGIMVCIMLNTLTMAMEHYQMTDG